MAGGGRSVPGGAPAVEKLLEVSRWGVGRGSRCAGPERSPALAAPRGLPAVGTGWRGRSAALCVSLRPAVCPRAPLPALTRCVSPSPQASGSRCAPRPLPTLCPPPRSPPALFPCTPRSRPSVFPRSRPVPCPGAGARPAGSARDCGAVRSPLGPCAAGGERRGRQEDPRGAARGKWDTGGHAPTRAAEDGLCQLLQGSSPLVRG